MPNEAKSDYVPKSAFKVGEEFARAGTPKKQNPFLGSRRTWLEFNQGYDAYIKRTGNFTKECPTP